MGIRGTVAKLIQRLPAGDKAVQALRMRRVQRDWSTMNRAEFEKTSLRVHTTIGLGDVAVARQVCEAFLDVCREGGDPRLGNIVITAGAWPPNFHLRKGDHNVYWWWSQNGREDWLDFYLRHARVKPDVVACLSNWCLDRARSLGMKALHLPLAVGSSFRKLAVERAGIGYGGSKGHKDHLQVDAIIGPFRDRPDFEWVDNLKTLPELNVFYNRKQIVLGMTEAFQERAGMVNNRVFEVLASGTPFIVHRHRAIGEIFPPGYPYQSASADESLHLAGEMLADYRRCLETFEDYRRQVERRHTYRHRLQALFAHLKSRNQIKI